MKPYHVVEQVKIAGDVLFLTVDGTPHQINLTTYSPKLLKADAATRAKFVISPSGYGIHWPLLDEDLSIDGLLGIKHQSPSTQVAV